MNGKQIRLLCITVLLVFSAPSCFYGKTPVETAAENEKVELKGDANAARTAWKLIDEGALLIDVRSAEEFEGGHIEGALNIPHSEIDALKAAIGPGLDRSVVFYCRSGNRAGRVQKQLENLGFTGIFNATGLDALQATRP